MMRFPTQFVTEVTNRLVKQMLAMGRFSPNESARASHQAHLIIEEVAPHATTPTHLLQLANDRFRASLTPQERYVEALVWLRDKRDVLCNATRKMRESGRLLDHESMRVLESVLAPGYPHTEQEKMSFLETIGKVHRIVEMMRSSAASRATASTSTSAASAAAAAASTAVSAPVTGAPTASVAGNMPSAQAQMSMSAHTHAHAHHAVSMPAHAVSMPAPAPQYTLTPEAQYLERFHAYFAHLPALSLSVRRLVVLLEAVQRDERELSLCLERMNNLRKSLLMLYAKQLPTTYLAEHERINNKIRFFFAAFSRVDPLLVTDNQPTTTSSISARGGSTAGINAAAMSKARNTLLDILDVLHDTLLHELLHQCQGKAVFRLQPHEWVHQQSVRIIDAEMAELAQAVLQRMPTDAPTMTRELHGKIKEAIAEFNKPAEEKDPPMIQKYKRAKYAGVVLE